MEAQKFFKSLALAFWALLPFPLFAEGPLSEQQLEQLKALYNQYVQPAPGKVSGIPGLGAAFYNGEDAPQVLVLGYTNPTTGAIPIARLDVPGAAQYVYLPAGTQVTPDTLFEIGSVSKTFTASLILQAKDRGMLRLDQEIDLWLPQVNYLKGANCPEGGDCPTIRELLDMRSGIPDNDDSFCSPPALCGNDLPPANKLITTSGNQEWQPFLTDAYLGSVSPTSEPGTEYLYSNINYYLLGEIASLTNNYYNLSDAYAQMISALPMHQTYFGGYQRVPEERRSMGYSSKGSARTNSKSFVSRYWSAGAVLSTPIDVAIWMYELMQPGHVLTPESLTEMKAAIPLPQPEPLDPNAPCLQVVGYGLGMMRLQVVLDGTTVQFYGHPGRTGGFLSIGAYLPDQKIGFSLLINRRDSANFSELVCKTIAVITEPE